MSKRLRFAVITPVYNTAKYLPECLDSLLAQTYENFVAFLIDDGSTDDSSQIIDKYAAQDSRMRVVHKKNGGVSSARNAALGLIEKDGKFDFIFFLDSDDILEPKCLDVVEKYLEKSGVDMLAYGFQKLDKTGIIQRQKKLDHAPKIYSRDEAYLFCFDNTDTKYTQSPAFSFFIGNIVLKSSAISGLRFDTSLKTGEDQNFRFKALQRVNKLLVISDRLMIYRLRKGSLSHSKVFSSLDFQFFTSHLQNAENLPTAFRRLIEMRIADKWWNSLRAASAKGSLDQLWPEAKKSLNFMMSTFVSNILQTGKYRKRRIMFSFGRTFIRLYFTLNSARSQRSKLNKMSNYFD